MDSAAQQHSLLLDLDARHDDLLRRLDELEKRVSKALSEYQPLAKNAGDVPDSQGDSGELAQ